MKMIEIFKSHELDYKTPIKGDWVQVDGLRAPKQEIGLGSS